MKGITYTGEHYRIIYLCDRRSEKSCVEMFRGEANKNLTKEIDNLEAYIDYSADHEQGPRSQYEQNFHEISKKDQLYRYRKGRLRAACFFEGKDIVVTHFYLKNQQKQPEDAARAAKLKVSYLQAIKSGTLELTERNDE